MSSRKNNVDLICDIGELAALFGKSRNLNDFLQTVVSVVAYHMSSAVCSVYLRDDKTDELVMTANQGLNPEMIGRLRLKPGEGLVGLALKELRTIMEGSGSRNPYYKYIPGSFEERYESFLAVPILRGLTRIGVLVVQDTQRDYFAENDKKALQAIAAQLATTIENAKLFMSLYEHQQSRDASIEIQVPMEDETPIFFKGVNASEGLACGRATIVGETDSYIRLTEEMERKFCTLDDFRWALQHSELQLEELQRQVEAGLSDVASMIFSAHLLMLKDEQFFGAMQRLIGQGRTPQQAITEVVNGYVSMFAKKANPLFKEKIADIKDVGHRLLHNVLRLDEMSPDYTGEIVIVGEMLPSDIVKFATQRAAGIIMVGGTITSHISILARSMQIPLILVEEPRVFRIPEGTRVLIDANVGSIFVNPIEEIIEKYEQSLAAHKSADEMDEPLQEKTLTKDRVRVRLLANINLLSELALADRFRAEGIGLYRSEFPFIVRSGFPSEEEQYRVYRTIVEHAGGRSVTLRTLDIGGDKMLSYFPTVTEANPFLGLRALRFTLQNKHVFVQQLRAMLRAAAGADFSIMFPMVASVDEFLQARDILSECSEVLTQQGIEHNPSVRVGPMIELPSAVEVAGELAQVADFLCVGTNDLVQYILAVDRTNEDLAEYYVPHHPAVLRSMKRVADAGKLYDIPVSICGEMAGDVPMLPFLIGIGIRQFSMAARLIPRVQNAIQKIHSRRATRHAEAMLSMGRISDLSEYLRQVVAPLTQ
jgi:phosphotransferase system enzyme I (PtsP)